jgi:dTDP-glucose 4,6-dehydratase
VVKKILQYYDNITNYEDYITDLIRPGQDVRYAIDDSKLKALGWKPKAHFDTDLEEIVSYYKNNFVW